MNFDYYEVTFSSPHIRTVEEYLNWQNSPAYNKELRNNPELFLQIVGSDGLTNRQRIESKYKSVADRMLMGQPASLLIIKLGTKLTIPTKQLNAEGLLTQGIEVITLDEPLFKAQQLAKLEADKGYVQHNKFEDPNDVTFLGESIDYYPGMTVWIWCRALVNENSTRSKDEELEGQIFNLTPFIRRINTNVSGSNGGNWHIELPPLRVVKKYGIWSIEEDNLATTIDGEFIADYTASGEGVNRYDQVFFHHAITANDLIFIRFEPLEMEGEIRFKDVLRENITNKDLPNRIYDMIGLVDANSISVDPEQVKIHIRGRDLSKVFIEDGTYFYVQELSQGSLGFYGDSQAKSSLFKRVFSEDGALYQIGLYGNHDITSIVQFVIDQFSNMSVVPSKLFEAWKDENGQDRRSQRFTRESLDYANKKRLERQNQQSLESNIQGSQHAKPDDVDHTDPGDVGVIKGSLIRELKKFFIEARVKGGTQILPFSTNGFGERGGPQSIRVGDWKSFVFEASNGISELVPAGELPPQLTDPKDRDNIFNIFTRDEIVQLWNEVKTQQSEPKYSEQKEEVGSKTTIAKGQSAKKEPMPGIWGIIKLAVDPQIARRKVIDGSFSSAHGSLMNFIHKVIQQPFAEFLMDTYGDEYVLTLRQPPTTKEAYSKLLDGICNTDNDTQTISIVDIDAVNVEDEDLRFDDQEVYSWYHMTPTQSFLGDAGRYNMYYLPAVLLPEYAEIFGSRPCDISHSYWPIDVILTDKKGTGSLSNAEKQAFLDYKYLIESTAYLPFTRKGTIVLSNGDRRIKVGNMIRYKRTGEIFMVTGVQQSFGISESSIERKTIIQVNRGMVEANIIPNNYNVEEKRWSYFDIVKVNVDFTKTRQQDKYKEVIREEERIVQVVDYDKLAEMKKQEEMKTKKELGTSVSTENVNEELTVQVTSDSQSSTGLKYQVGRYKDGKFLPTADKPTETAPDILSVKKQDQSTKQKPDGSMQISNDNLLRILNGGVTFIGDAKYDRPSVNPSLIRDLEYVAAQTGIKIVVTTAKSKHRRTTHSGYESRHYRGLAVDIAILDDSSYGYKRENFQKLGDLVVSKLVERGYVRNKESGNQKAVLWRTTNHYNHIHVSNNKLEVENTTGLPMKNVTQIDKIKELVKDGVETVPDRDKIFSVEVNKEALNYFLTQSQFTYGR